MRSQSQVAPPLITKQDRFILNQQPLHLLSPGVGGGALAEEEGGLPTGELVHPQLRRAALPYLVQSSPYTGSP